MGKVKIKRKSTFIDMTAMSDVTVLLLTFFMLTSTFLQKEPVIVNTPSSVSEEKVPAQNLVTILISRTGNVYLSIAGDADTTYSSDKMRKELLQNVVAEYNKINPKSQVQLTEKQANVFSKMNSYGMPMAQLSQFLNLEADKQDKAMDPDKNAKSGIPIDMNENLEMPNEFQMWMRGLFKSSDQNLVDAIKDGKGIAIKADKGTPYEVVNVVMDNLQTLKMNKFTFMTALKSEEE